MDKINTNMYIYDTMINCKFPTLIGYFDFPNGIGDNFKLDKNVKFVDIVSIYDRDVCFRAYVGEVVKLSDIKDKINVVDINTTRINSILYGKDVKYVVRRENDNVCILNFLKPNDFCFENYIDLENFLIELANETKKVNYMKDFMKILEIKKHR